MTSPSRISSLTQLDDLETVVWDAINYFLPPFVTRFLQTRKLMRVETTTRNDVRNSRRVPELLKTLEPIVFDGEEFRVHESMMERPPNFWSLENAPLKGFCLICFWPLAWSLIVVATLVILRYGPKASKKIASYTVPLICTGIDHKLCHIRKELLKNMHGNVLDFGSGGGIYTKYVLESRQAVEKYVSLEINADIHPRLRQAHAACKKACEDRKKEASSRPSTDSGVSLLSSRLDKNAHTQNNEVMSKDTNKEVTGAKTTTAHAAASFPSSPSFEIQSQLLQRLKDNHTFPPHHFDWILCGNVLCQVQNPDEQLRLLDYFLKPGGRVYYSEHVQSRKRTWRYVLQQCINPWWSLVFNGCNCNRDTLGTIQRVTRWKVKNWSFFFGVLPWIDELAIGICAKPREEGHIIM